MSFVNYKDNTTNISLVKGQFYELSMLRLSITPTAVESDAETNTLLLISIS